MTYLVLAQILNVEALLLPIPEDDCMLLAKRVGVVEVEVVEVIVALVSPDFDFEFAFSSDVKFAPILSD